MPVSNLQHHFNSTKDLKQATQEYFEKELGFNFENLKTTDQPVSIEVLGHKYNLNVVFQLTDEEINNPPKVDGVDPGHQSKTITLSKYLVCSYDFGNLDKIPSKSLLASFNRQLSAQIDSKSGMPNLIVFRYTVNGKIYLTFSVSELRDKPNQRTGKYIVSKVILLKDVDIFDTHQAHIRILSELNINKQNLKYRDFNQLHEHWLKTLNIKELSDKFYKQIKIRYDDLVENIVLPPQNSPSLDIKKDFALRLVGRLIFCWFLKAKGWIPSTLLSFEAINQNYYRQILEPLFFESLNKDPKDRDFDEKYKFESVPYLNGGLFEAKTDDYYKPNQLDPIDRQNILLKIPNTQIQDIFSLFDEYYFTIDENTSTEQEIGVDPEMMGRIFENFILNRSSTGSFYTPREIVDYMVTSSLKEVLKTKEIPSNVVENLFDDKYWNATEAFRKDFGHKIVASLKSLKILDPACGSGAFPMGVLQKLTEIIHHLEPEKSLYEIKLDILQNCIYGVDILPIATEISRLRCWLSLVVDEDKNDPKPLPNLEFKFVTANSLVGIKHLDSGLGQDEIELKQNELKELRRQTFKPAQNKLELKDKWDKLSLELFDLQVNSGFYNKTNSTDLSGWNPFENKSSEFFDPEWMFGIEGFDLVIGNPPYVGEKGNRDTFEPLKQSELGKRFYQGKMDLFYFFFHLGLDILKNGGVLNFITTNYYITATGGTKLRNDFKTRSNVINLINFGELKIFESALGQHNLITTLQKKSVEEGLSFHNSQNGETGSPLRNNTPFARTIITQNKGYLGNQVLENIIEDKDPNTNYYQISQAKLFDENGYIKLTNGVIDEVLDKMLVGSERLDQICHINTGFNSGADWVTNSNLEQIDNSNIYSKGQGIFALTIQEFQKLNPEISLTYKFYKNSDIEAYCPLTWQELYIIYVTKNTEIEKFPSIKNHLLHFKPFLEIKREFQTGQLPWYSMHWAREIDIFTNKDKIVLPYRSKRNTFTYSNSDCFGSKDILYLRKKVSNTSIKFLLGVLNSKLIYKWLYYRGKRKGEMLELYQKPLSEIPIPILDTPEKQGIAFEIEVLVEQILELKNGDGDGGIASTVDLENKIDELVFELYGLGEEEKNLIKSN